MFGLSIPCVLLLLYVSPTLYSARTNTCFRAQQAYPSASYPTQHHVFWPSLCPGEVSCCSSATEQSMIKRAWGFPDLVYSSLDPFLVMFENHTMMPLYFIPEVSEFLYSDKKLNEISYTDVLYGIIRLVVDDPGRCLDDERIEKIAETTLPHVKNITNSFYALQANLDAIYESLQAVRYHNITNQCYEKVIQNGIPVDRQLRNVMCPVCNDETASTRSCHSTCINTVRGCFADVTSIIPLYEEVLNVMDKQHLELKFMMISRYGDLSKIIFYIQSAMTRENIDCVRKNPFSGGYKDSGNYLNKHPKMYSSNKGLSGILSAPEELPCSLSKDSTTSCWTGSRAAISYDSGFVRAFTEPGQMMNPELPYQREPSPYILEAKTTLEKALQTSQMAKDGELLLDVRSKKGHGFDKSGVRQDKCVNKYAYFLSLLITMKYL